MHVRAPILLSIAPILYDSVNRPLRPLACTKCFLALETFVFVATPFWWCEPLLSQSGFFFVRLHSFLVWRNIVMAYWPFPFALTPFW